MLHSKKRPRVKGFRHRESKHWTTTDEMHEVLHSFPGWFRSVLLELLEKPRSGEEIAELLKMLMFRVGGGRKKWKAQGELKTHIASALEKRVLVEQKGKYALTPGGREMAEHIQEVVPFFLQRALSAETVSRVTIITHAFLSLIKLGIGMLSRSSGLIADGIDNTVDTVSSVLVWLGIKFKRERLVSVLIIVMMFVSVGGIGLESYGKLVAPGPVQNAPVAFIVSALCGLLMLGLSAYQYFVGKRISNFPIICQAVDSRNHFLTSLLVCAGIILSVVAGVLPEQWSRYLYSADAVASIFIGLLILKSAVELLLELFKPEGEPTRVSHFLGNAQEKLRSRIIYEWLSSQLEGGPLSRQSLKRRFAEQFCEKVPKILILSEMGYRPAGPEELGYWLNHFVGKGKLLLSADRFRLPGDRADQR
jgi:Co/Zn/Cd efflux system component